jgi:hypothetical protein
MKPHREAEIHMKEGAALEMDGEELTRKTMEHRIYRHRVTGIIIVACSLTFLGGLWASGLNLEDLVWRAGMFDPSRHVCLKSKWFPTTRGDAGRVELCNEWIDLSDLSGRIHTLMADNLEVVKGPDGVIRTRLQRGVNYRLVAVAGFLMVIILIGRFVQHYFIKRHMRQMGFTR